MILGIFSDAHGDIKAVQQALLALAASDKKLYLGDICEFTPSVKECIDLLEDNNVTAVKGNCDRYAVVGDSTGRYQAWLTELPNEYREENLVFVHEPKDPSRAFAYEEFYICFCGHTHRSFMITPNGQRRIYPGESLQLDPELKYIIGIGSVSKPRGGENKVVALYDTNDNRLDLIDI